MKREINAEGKQILRLTKSEWEALGQEKGWTEEPKEEPVDLGWTLDKQAAVTDDRNVGSQWVCKVCSYFGPDEDFGQGCPNCGSKFIDK